MILMKNDEHLTDLFSFGKGSTKFLFNIPHGGSLLPFEDTENLWLSFPEIEYQSKLLSDLGTIDLFNIINENNDHSFVQSNTSRLWVDIERFDNKQEVMNQVGMGVVYERDANKNLIYRSPLTESILTARKESLYYPYHNALNMLTKAIIEEHGECILIDLHSYRSHPLPYEIYGEEKRPQICLGWNEDPQSKQLVTQAYNHLSQYYTIGLNETFKGSLIPNDYYPNTPPELKSVMLEIRRDVFQNEKTFDLNYRNLITLGEHISELLENNSI